jgi:hypothetical protein
MSWWRHPLRTALALAHAAGGWIAYRLGRLHFARRRYERVLLLRGADFGAYVHLGRIAFDLGDYATWRREFAHARRADPVRFEQLDYLLEWFEPRLAGTPCDAPRSGSTAFGGADFDGTGARATWRSLMNAAKPGEGRGGRRNLQDLDGATESAASGDAGAPAPNPGDPARHDDCLSGPERIRFRRRGPITSGEVAQCDLDDLLRRLTT